MKFLENFFNSQRPRFTSGGKYEKFEPVFEAFETLFFFPSIPTDRDSHVRDSLDLKRFMTIVILALIPPFLFGLYNTGFHACMTAGEIPTLSNAFFRGLVIVLPLVIVSYTVGFAWEILFSVIRRHPISEGFLVTGLLFPLTLPPTMPLWQAAVGISFGVVIGKEIFGGTGRNILNPALTARAFVFFAYPSQMSGDSVWAVVCRAREGVVDAVSSATPLAISNAVEAGQSVEKSLAGSGYTLSKLFFGLHPGSIGETSAFMCMIGAVILIAAGIASYRIIIGGIIGVLAVTWPLHLLASFTGSLSPMLSLHPVYHLVMGGFAFGVVYMATDPVTAPGMERSRWIYGFAIGALTVLIRLFNPAYPEGVMLAILFMNLFSPLLDFIEIKLRLKRRIINV